MPNAMSYLFAYLDPGAGSMLLQMFLAGMLGLAYTIRTYWRRIMRFGRPEHDHDSAMPEPPPVQARTEADDRAASLPNDR